MVPGASLYSVNTKQWTKSVLVALCIPLHLFFEVSDTSNIWSKTVAPSRASQLVEHTMTSSRMSLGTVGSPWRSVQSTPQTQTCTMTGKMDNGSFAGWVFFGISFGSVPATTPTKLAYLGRITTNDPMTSFGSLADYRLLGTSEGLVCPKHPFGASVNGSPSYVGVHSNF